jgi:hypothetical protein
MNKNQLKLANYMYFEKNDKLRFSRKFFTEAAEITPRRYFREKSAIFPEQLQFKKSEHHLPHSHPNQKKQPIFSIIDGNS